MNFVFAFFIASAFDPIVFLSMLCGFGLIYFCRSIYLFCNLAGILRFFIFTFGFYLNSSPIFNLNEINRWLVPVHSLVEFQIVVLR